MIDARHGVSRGVPRGGGGPNGITHHRRVAAARDRRRPRERAGVVVLGLRLEERQQIVLVLLLRDVRPTGGDAPSQQAIEPADAAVRPPSAKPGDEV